MSAALRLREDYDAPHMRALAKASQDANQTRRLLVPAAIGGVARQPFDKLRSAQVGGGLQRAWALGASRRQGAGQPTAAQPRAALRRIITAGPNPAVDGVVRWRLIDLAQWVYAEFRISISKQTLSRMLRTMGYRELSARPRHHAQDPAALEAFKKTLPRVWRRSRNMRPQASR